MAETAVKSLKKAKNFRVTVTMESELLAPVTLRTELTAKSAKSATSRAATWANRNRPKNRRFVSWIIVIENLSEPEQAPDATV